MDKYSKKFFQKSGKRGQKKFRKELGEDGYRKMKAKARKGKFKRSQPYV